MRKIISLLLFTFLSAFAILAQTPTQTPKPGDENEVVKISTTLIQIDVTVTDKSGKIVGDLKPEDFEVFENGVKQDVTSFSFVSNTTISAVADASKGDPKNNIPLPPRELKPQQVRRTVALVVDDLSLSYQSTYYIQRALKKFVNEQMQDGDLVAIIRTGTGIGALQQFTSDKRQLLAAIEKIRWNPVGTGTIGAFSPIQNPMGSVVQHDEQANQALEAVEKSQKEFDNFRQSAFAVGTLGAVNFIVRGMKDLPGRKSVMLLSDGFELFTKNEGGFTDSAIVLDSLRRLVDLATRSSVVIYTMDARGLQTTGVSSEDDVGGFTTSQVEQKLSDRRDQLFNSQEGLIYLARETGGLAVYNSNDLSKGIERMLNDQSYYLIGYQPDAETFDPGKRRFNKLEIKVKRDDVKVRYRSGFFGVKDEEVKSSANGTPTQQITTALTSPFAVNDISLRLNTLFGNDKQGSFVRSLLHVNAKDLKFTDEPDGSKKATFDIMAVNFGEGSQPLDQLYKSYSIKAKGESYQKLLDEGFVYYFTFQIKKPGAYQYRVAVRDKSSAKVGSANQFIEVPDLKKDKLNISGIFLENLTLAQWQKFGADPITQSSLEKTTPTETDPLSDTSLRRFKSGTVLRYGFEVYNSKLDSSGKPDLSTQIKVFRDGKILLEGKQKPLELLDQTDLQRIKSAGVLSLGNEMEAGDYVLQIIITDNLEKRRIATQFVQFEVVK